MTRSDTELVALIDEIYMECPFFGQRQLRNELQKLGHRIGRNRIRWLMKLMGIEALCPKPSTSKSSPAHKKYPYLLRNVGVTEVAQVWCTDITYIPMPLLPRCDHGLAKPSGARVGGQQLDGH